MWLLPPALFLIFGIGLELKGRYQGRTTKLDSELKVWARFFVTLLFIPGVGIYLLCLSIYRYLQEIIHA
jgi:hypothetical protein